MAAKVELVEGSAGLDAEQVMAGSEVNLQFSVANNGDEDATDKRAMVAVQDPDNAPVGGHQWVALGHVAAGDSRDYSVRIGAPDDNGEYQVYLYVDHDGHSSHGGLAHLSFSVGGGEGGSAGGSDTE